MTGNEAAADAVRSYLRLLRAQRDEDETDLAALLRQLESVADVGLDVIEEAHLRQRILDLQTADELRRAFIRHAKSWAEQTGTSAVVLSQMGVPDDVLRQARLHSAAAEGQGEGPPEGGGTPSRADVRQYVVDRYVPEQLEPGGFFSASDVRARTGASKQSVIRALKDLASDGRLREATQEEKERLGDRRKTYYTSIEGSAREVPA